MSRLQAKMRVRFTERETVCQTQLTEPVVIVVEDKPLWSKVVAPLCEFLEVRVECVGGDADLREALQGRRPMAVLASMEGKDQDGCHILKLVGQYDSGLATMMMTGNDPVLIGAAQAIQEVWGLSGTILVQDLPSPGQIMEFLFSAGQRGRCLGLLPT